MRKFSRVASRKLDHWFLPHKNKGRVVKRGKFYISKVQAARIGNFLGMTNDIRRNKPKPIRKILCKNR